MFTVDEMFLSVERSLSLLKWTGALLIFGTILYFMFNKKRMSYSFLTWEKVIGLSIGMGMINAGIVIVFGKTAFFVTPMILVLSLIFWLTNKFPISWKGKHVVVFGFIFAISSVAVFFCVAFTFFHLAIEGKM